MNDRRPGPGGTPPTVVIALVILLGCGGLCLTATVVGALLFERQEIAGRRAREEAAHDRETDRLRALEAAADLDERRAAATTRRRMEELRQDLEAKRGRDGRIPDPLPEAPRDGWGTPLLLRVTLDRADFEIASLGADGTEGGIGIDADLLISGIR